METLKEMIDDIRARMEKYRRRSEEWEKIARNRDERLKRIMNGCPVCCVMCEADRPTSPPLLEAPDPKLLGDGED